MDLVINGCYIVVFIGMIIISARVLLDMNINSIFKQGKIGSIRAFYVIVILLVSGIVAFTFTELIKAFYNFFNN